MAKKQYLDLTGLTTLVDEIKALLSGKANSSHNHAASNITSGTLSSDRLPTVPIDKGGTGATTAAAVLTNLGLTATAAELNKMDGVTATTTELNYVDGVTSNIQTQLDSKAASSTLTSHTGNKNNPHGVTAEQVGALPSSGGNLTGVIDASGISNILDFGTSGWFRGKTTSGSKYDIFGYSTPTILQVGGSYPALALKGKNTRPTYNDSDVALYSDIPTDYAASSHTHDDRYYTESEINTKLAGKSDTGHTHNYAGSSSAGGAATSANKVNSSLTVKLNGGSTEGTNMFTFNGSAAKSVNITPASIGAQVAGSYAASSHTHDDRYYTESEINTKLAGKSDTNHTHNYAGSSSAGGAATSANKVNSSLTVKLNGGSTEGTNMFTFNGSAAKSVNITPASIGAQAAGSYMDLASAQTATGVKTFSNGIKIGSAKLTYSSDALIISF